MKVDPDFFKQVIINLIDNSIKYSKSPVIDIILRKKDKVVLEVVDYVCGIDLKNLESLSLIHI